MPSSPMNSKPISSDHQLTLDEQKPPILQDTTDVVTIAQLPPSITPPLAPLTPSSQLMGKCNLKRLTPDKVVHESSRKLLRKENASEDFKAPVEMSQTMIRAREVQSTLGNVYPSFIKTMGLPAPFCKRFLPKHDSLMVLEDEDGKQFNLKFIGNRIGFSAGWGKFAVTHKLHEGDVLIFQLVESCKFKVYIVRANDSKNVNGVVDVTNQDGYAEHKSPGLSKVINANYRSKVKTYSHVDHSVVNPQVQGGTNEPNLSLQDVKTFNDFHIMVGKQCIDSELSDEIRMNYFNLCIGKNEFLHSGVREGLYYKLVAGVIGETVNIANMIRNCKLTTRMEEFAAWDSSLEYFELIGMEVGFLRDRIRELASLAFLAFESEDARKCVHAKEERDRNAFEIKVLEAKLVDLYESNRKLDKVVDGYKDKAEKYKIEFQKKVNEPWYH